MIVYATEDERHRAVQEEALKLARLQPARLVLYDAGAGSSSPRATRWSGETDGDVAGGQLMTPSQLKASGRHAIAAQVQHASDQGVEAFAWLPENRSLDTLIEYAVAQSADTIIVPHELADATFVSRFRRRTLERMKRNADVALLIVSADGSVET